MKDKHGCFNCAFRKDLICLHKSINEQKEWMKGCLRVMDRPVDEKQLKIPLTEREAFETNCEEGDMFGSECPTWQEKEPKEKVNFT